MAGPYDNNINNALSLANTLAGPGAGTAPPGQLRGYQGVPSYTPPPAANTGYQLKRPSISAGTSAQPGAQAGAQAAPGALPGGNLRLTQGTQGFDPKLVGQTTPRPKGGWWASLKPEGQQAVLRTALAMGSNLLSQGDPYKENPLTWLSEAATKGLDVYDVAKAQGREGALRRDVRAIDPALSAAGQSRAIGGAYQAAGDPVGMAGMLRQAVDLTPKPAAPPEAFTLSQGQQRFVSPAQPGGEARSIAAVPAVEKQYAPVKGEEGASYYDQKTGEKVFSVPKQKGKHTPETLITKETFPDVSEGNRELARESLRKGGTIKDAYTYLKPGKGAADAVRGIPIVIRNKAGEEETVMVNTVTGEIIKGAKLPRPEKGAAKPQKAQFVQIPTGELDVWDQPIKEPFLVLPDPDSETGYKLVPPPVESEYGPIAPHAPAAKTQNEFNDIFKKLRGNANNKDYTDDELIDAMIKKYGQGE